MAGLRPHDDGNARQRPTGVTPATATRPAARVLRLLAAAGPVVLLSLAGLSLSGPARPALVAALTVAGIAGLASFLRAGRAERRAAALMSQNQATSPDISHS
jgi:hypothetical protein